MFPSASNSLTPVMVVWDETNLTIIPAVESLKPLLKVEVKTIEQKQEIVEIEGEPTAVNRGNKVVKRVMKLYDKVPAPNGKSMLITQHGFIDLVLAHFQQENIPYTVKDMRMAPPVPDLTKMSGFRFSQEALLSTALVQRRSGLIGAPTRFGKCFGPGTRVLMVDGSAKNVEDIKEGELVMGPDSKPRRVTGCVVGWGKMYRVKPNYNGMVWTCNEDHILHVQRTRECNKAPNKLAGTLENVTVRDWLKSSKWFRHLRKLRRVSVSYPKSAQRVPAYIYGLWLGDGHSSGVSFTNAEPEIWNEIEKWAQSEGLTESGNTQKKGLASTRRWVLNLGTGNTKRGTNEMRAWFRARPKSSGIRPEYLIADESQRWELLAGLLDTDGESAADSNCGIITKHEQLARDIVKLCNSLGLGASCRPCKKKSQHGTEGNYWRVGIRGPSDKIPFRVPRKTRVRSNKFNCLTVGFSVEEAGYGAYFGFELEGPDRLFLLEDCTVVHNTTLILNACRAFEGYPIVVVIPGRDLLKQTHDALCKALPNRRVTKVFGGSGTQSSDITVCSMDSLQKLDGSKVRVMLVDEPHALPTESRTPEFTNFTKALKLGFGATLEGRFDGKDPLITGLIGPVLSNRTYREAVAEGAISPIVVYMLKLEIPKTNIRQRATAYKNLFFQSPKVAQVIRELFTTGAVIPANWQVLGFISSEDQVKFLQEQLQGLDFDVAMAKLMNRAEREEKMQKLSSGETMRCLASNIYAQGVTFSDLRVMVNIAGGGASTQSIQKPGRVAEIRPGKKAGVVIDFLCVPSDRLRDASPGNAGWCLVRDSKARHDHYVKTGFHTYVVDSTQQIAQALQSLL